MIINPQLCAKCKGVRRLCGLKVCPIKAKLEQLKTKELPLELKATTYNVFVGEFGYPKINVGVLALPYNTVENPIIDNPRSWSYKPEIKEIIKARINSLDSYEKKYALVKNNRYIETIQEIAMTKDKVDSEIELKKKPKLRYSFDTTIFPHGFMAPLKEISLEENPKVDQRIEKAFYDTDAKAYDIVNELFEKKVDEYSLVKGFSSGLFGRKLERKFVPTRWAITAVDDTLGKKLLNELRTYEIIDGVYVYYGNNYGNYFFITLLPMQLFFELYEIHLPNSVWNHSKEAIISHDYESFFGRKEYAKNTIGGYYAARLPVLEALNKLEKQAGIFVIRIVTDEYWAPLGVWVVREAVKEAMKNKIEFESLKLAEKFLEKYIMKKFNYDIKKIVKESKCLKNFKNQTKLSYFIN